VLKFGIEQLKSRETRRIEQSFLKSFSVPSQKGDKTLRFCTYSGTPQMKNNGYRPVSDADYCYKRDEARGACMIAVGKS